MAIPVDIEIALQRVPKQWHGMIGAIITASKAMGEGATSDRDALLAMLRKIFDDTHDIIAACGGDVDAAYHGFDAACDAVTVAFVDAIDAEEEAPAYRAPYSTMNHRAQGLRT